MCKAMEDMRNEAARETVKLNSIDMARMLLVALGKLSYEEIAQSVRLLTVNEVFAAEMLEKYMDQI